MLSSLRRHLALKLFLSYLVVVLVGAAVLASAVGMEIPRAFNRHLGPIGPLLNGLPAGLTVTLFSSFRAGVFEALTLGALAAILAALLVSLLVSRQVVAPVQAMRRASQRIAEGHYEERVSLGADVSKGELDELAELALNFNQMAARLEQTEALRRQLIGDVTHELRTPLASIKGSLEGLMDGVLPASPATLQQIYLEADRLQRLVNDLQELSRVEAGAYELNRQPVPVARLVESVIARLGRQFEEKGVALESNLPDDLPAVSVDEDRIGQVLLNLAGNALQYTPEGGRVRIRAEKQAGDVAFSISDTGIGIPAEHLPHIFTRFYRVDRSRSRSWGGSGIGLTIARYLVEAHGGRIWVESAGAGLGSTFTFTLPVAG